MALFTSFTPHPTAFQVPEITHVAAPVVLSKASLPPFLRSSHAELLFPCSAVGAG